MVKRGWSGFRFQKWVPDGGVSLRASLPGSAVLVRWCCRGVQKHWPETPLQKGVRGILPRAGREKRYHASCRDI